MRQDQNRDYPEVRDGVDVNWYSFLNVCGFCPVLLPNTSTSLEIYASLKHQLHGLLLTGGNDLSDYGGDCLARDELEIKLLAQAKIDKLPVLGVCRGMQLILTQAGSPLHRVNGHVCPRQQILYNKQARTVNSYHNWGATELPDGFLELARSEDGVLKAVRSIHDAVMGIMWHPERMQPFSSEDINLFGTWFNQ